jgi:hypothetical protein
MAGAGSHKIDEEGVTPMSDDRLLQQAVVTVFQARRRWSVRGK